MQTRFRRRLSASLSCALVVAAVCAGMARAETLIVERPMPAPMVEHAPPPPSAGYNWVPGHWVWRGFEWTWAPGHYVQAAVAPMPAVIVETRPPRPSPSMSGCKDTGAGTTSAMAGAGTLVCGFITDMMDVGREAARPAGFQSRGF